MRNVLSACLVLLLSACQAHEAPAPQYAPLDTFPPLGPAKAVDPDVVVHQVSLAHDDHADRVWIYLPRTLPATPIPAVFITAAGVPSFIGSGFGPDLDRGDAPEHL